jgi:hypothetical protein
VNAELVANPSTGARTDGVKRLRDLPALRFDVDEAKDILRMSRAQLYNRISEGAITVQKDGARTYISLRELERYVDACECRSLRADRASSPGQACVQRGAGSRQR